MNSALNHAAFHPVRRDRLLQEAEHDTYKTKGKLPEPTVCPDCGAVFHAGRWQWLARPAAAHEERCPACHRQHDEFPAGYVHLSGDFLHAHEAEILSLVRHQEAQEKAEHPLKRIMKIAQVAAGYEITTTDIHLARRIGEALHHAYQGELEFHYNPQQCLLRVNWLR
jgi:NMD protein affecting ribosome stability and mRNA decay